MGRVFFIKKLLLIQFSFLPLLFTHAVSNILPPSVQVDGGITLPNQNNAQTSKLFDVLGGNVNLNPNNQGNNNNNNNENNQVGGGLVDNGHGGLNGVIVIEPDGGIGNVLNPDIADPLPPDSITIDYNQTNQVDQDNDVPTLLSIRYKMEQLEKETRGFRKKVNNLQVDENNETFYDIESLNSETTLADIHTELQKLVLHQERSVTKDEDILETIEEKGEDFSSLISENWQEKIDEFGSPIMDEVADPVNSAMINFNAGSRNFSFDLFNTDHEAVPSVMKAGEYIKKVCIFVVCMIFLFALKHEVLKVLGDMPKYVTVAPVTNYSIMGNSVGALQIKTASLVIAGTAVLAILTTLGTAINEAGFLQNLAGFGTLVGFFNSLTSSAGFMGEALKWLNVFIPLTTISTAIMTYYMTILMIKLEMIAITEGRKAIS